jgi:hypothetical protein
MDIAIWISLAVLVGIVAFVLGRMSRPSDGGYVGQAPNARQAPRPSPPPPPPGSDADADDEIRRLLAANQVIEAIKRYREVYGVGLKEAKDAIDAMR